MAGRSKKHEIENPDNPDLELAETAVLAADALGARFHWYWAASHPRQVEWLTWLRSVFSLRVVGIRVPEEALSE